MTDLTVPSVAESITEVTLSRYLVKEGDYVEMDQPVCELETDKASQEIPAPVAGTVQFVAREGDDLKIGAVICRIDESAAKPAAKSETLSPQSEISEAPAAEPETGNRMPETFASPAAKKILAEKEIPESDVKGTGVKGRITKDDAVKAEKKELPSKSEIKETPVTEKKETSAETKAPFSRGERVEKMSRLRKTISERLVYSKNSTAMLTTFNEVDMTAIYAIREKYADKFKKKYEVSLGLMSFFTKAVCLALQKFPAVNASIDEGNIIYHDYCDISIAVSTPRGLVVPVIRNAESLSLSGIEKKVKELAVKGRDGLLTMEEMTGGTFTISNGGVFGSLMSTPIINPPQVAILGMHKVEDRPVALNGQLVIRPMMYVALSYDHRIIDGKESVSFLVAVKQFLEHPERMFNGADPVELLLDV